MFFIIFSCLHSTIVIYGKFLQITSVVLAAVLEILIVDMVNEQMSWGNRRSEQIQTEK